MLLGIDQGTTGTTAVLLSDTGEFISSVNTTFPQHYPHPAWVEHDPEEIWNSVKLSVLQLLQNTNTPTSSIKGIGITNQRETVTLFEDKKALHPFIVWQDRRTADDCKKLARYKKKVLSLSGLPIDPYFSASKISWLIKKLRLSPKKNNIRFRTIDSFLIHRLTGHDAIEVTNASRTSLMNLKSLKWDPFLLKLFGVPKNFCPPIISSEGFSFLTKDLDFLPDGIPVCAALGDQQAALFGQCGWKKGVGKITYGTGSFVLLNTGNKPIISKNGLVSTVGLQWKNKNVLYALEGSAFISGAWIQWLRDQLKIFSLSKDSEKLALEVSSSEGVYVIPALTGIGAPFWNPHLRGTIGGLTRGSDKRHIARASLEALAFQNSALIQAMKKDAKTGKSLWRVDGGAVQNNLLLQIQSDILGDRIDRPTQLEATGIGVALLAGISRGLLSLKDIEARWKLDRSFNPDRASQKKLQILYKFWLQTIRALEKITF